MDKPAYTPEEFASLFGHEKSWTYRMRRTGKLKAITDMGKLMIPASEAERLSKGGTASAKSPSVSDGAIVPAGANATEEWKTWVANKRAGRKPKAKSAPVKRTPRKIRKDPK